MRYTLNVAMLALAAVLAGVPAFAAADTVGKLAENTASDHVSFCPGGSFASTAHTER